MKRLFILLICTLSMARVVLAQPPTGTTLDLLNVRAEPIVSDNIITQIPIATNVTIQGRDSSGAWLLVSVDDVVGWVSARYVDWEQIALMDLPVTGATANISTRTTTVQPTPIHGDNVVPVTSLTRLNIRSAPTTSAGIVGILNFDERVSAFGRTPDSAWLAVDSGNLRGWVSIPFVSYVGDINGLPIIDDLTTSPISTIVQADSPAPVPVVTDGRYVFTGPAPNNSTSYDVEITLHWNSTANLDLRVIGPDGYLIVPGVPPSPTGGYFQQPIGANENCENARGAPLEVITWRKGTAPSGLYQIEAEHVHSCFPEQEEETLFWVSFKNDGPEVEFWVYFIKPGDLFEFEFVRP